MCGIVGYVGRNEAAPILLEGLSRLEYRGYDSAGICVEQNGVLEVAKAKGRLQNLIAKTDGGAKLPGTLGIGHTRWATHGEPNDINSHPHVSQNGKIAVVHNGIIENYLEIREFLQEKGVQFTSQTDSEVVAQLMEYCMGLPEVSTVSDALYMVLHRIEGAYALGILCSDDPDHIYAARKDAPLLLGFGKGENFIASDVTALVKYTRDVVYMEDGEVAILGRDGIQLFNAMELPIEKEHHHIDWEISAAEKGGYEHFMLKEIMEEPEALRRAILPRIKDGEVVFDGLQLDISRYDSIKIIACGSSYHVGMVGKYNLEKLARIPVEVVLASEFRYCDPIIDSRTLVVVISQSGETLDTMAALREAKSLGARIVSIVNVVGSSIARESDDVLYTWAGPEIAVATTKAYSTQMAVLDLLHDFAKEREFTFSGLGMVTDYSLSGQLIGHLVMGAQEVQQCAESLGLPQEKSLLLQHMILSHHGEPDFGAAVRPMCAEAELLSLIDLVDSRMEIYAEALQELPEGTFSGRIFALDKKIYRHH